MVENEHISPEDRRLSLQQIIDSSPALIHTARPDGFLDFFNRIWIDFSGEPLEKLLGWGWTSCIHPEDAEVFVEKMRESFSKGKPFQEISRVRRADGVYRWMMHLKVPVFDKVGNLIKWNGSSIDIDDRKRAEEQLIKSARELQRNEFYLSEAQRLGHIGSWVFDPSTGFEHWSHELFQIHGLDPSEGPPSSEQYLARMHPEDREFMASLMKRMRLGDSGFDVTKRIVRAGGEVRYVRCVGTAVSGNTPSKLMGVGIDVTDHEVLTQELRRREAYLAEAQRLSHTGSFGWRPDTGENIWSEETYRIFEYSPGEKATLDRIIERVHPEDRALMLETAGRASSQGGAIDVTLRLLFSDGRVKHVRVLARPLELDSHGFEFAGAVIDITEAKQAEDRIRRSEKELRTLVESIPAYVGTARPDGTIDFVSQSWLDYTGFTEEQEHGLGWAWAGAIHPDDADRVLNNWQRALTTGEPVEHEVRFRNAAGNYYWFLTRCFPLRDDEGNIVKWYGIVFDINALKETESTLRTREHQLRGIIETIPSMLWSTSPTGKPTNLSRRFLEYYGLSFEEFINSKPERCVHPDDLEAAGKAFVQAMSSGGSYSAIHRLRRADGEYRWQHAMAEPLRDPEGKIIQWYGITVDIDERKRAEEALRKSERELRTLIDVMPAFVGTASPDGLCDFLSESWLDYLGFTLEQGLGWGWASAIHPEDVDRVVANWRAGLAAGKPVEQELRCRRADGTYRWFLNRDLPLRDDEGKIIKWYGVLTNIDALKETESALRAREHQLRGIIETIPSMFWSTSPAGEITHINQKVLEFLGVTLEEYINRGWVDFLHPDDREKSAKVFSRAIETGGSYNVTYRVRRADGEYRWQHTRAEPLRDPQGKIIQWYGLSIDIDEGKRAEDHLRDTRIELARASRLATVAELAGSIAHELNQPLMSILANAQAARRWLSAAPPNVMEVNSSVERVIRDARAADETMQHIRALFKQESFDKKDVDIPHILREVVRVVQEDPKKREVPIECYFDEPLPAVHIDQIQIQQVFINLIVNAIEALEGQQVLPLVTLRAIATGSDGMLIQVIDNGPGVHDSERIFDAFVTTKKKGMGIGLAVSRSIVEAHGGRLWAENNINGGATFNVALPLTQSGHLAV